MLSVAVRTVIMYFFMIVIMRLMGKRQIGQLQPGELVITIMISEIAAIPIDKTDEPLIEPLTAIVILAGLEIIISLISLKSIRIRQLLQGNSLVVIRNGKVDEKQMRRMRYTMDDLLEALRQNDVFNIDEVQYAITETDGSLSVLLKPEYRPLTIGDTDKKPSKDSMPFIIISDGRIIKSSFSDCGMTQKKLDNILKKKKLRAKDILLMTCDENGNINIVRQSEK